MSNDAELPPDDRVRVIVNVPVGRDEMWRSITAPARVDSWFGTLQRPMRAGTETRVDFGDGDFFDIAVDEVEPGSRLAFRWRFLGVGPECRIVWQVSGDRSASTLTVDDDCPDRPAAERAQLRAGWLDFVDRLSGHLMTGRPTRYEWRPEIDGSVVLPTGDWHPLRPENLADWLPIATDGTGSGWFFIVDSEGPRRFAVHDWRLEPDRALSFAVEIPSARATTAARARAERTARGTTLSVEHHGWHRLGLSDLQSRMLRHRFAATWAAALSAAEERAHSRQELR